VNLVQQAWETTQNLTINNTVSAVPLPAAVWLLGSSLVGFMGMRRKAKQA